MNDTRPDAPAPDRAPLVLEARVAFLERGGEMGARMRAFDWTATPLGSPQQWPQSLKTIVRILLDSRYAMWMLWGPELTFFCNDAYLPTVGIKRDWVLGARSDKVWAEIWPDIGPRIAHVLATGEATWDEGLLLFLERSGYPEETYHTFSYSPVYDDAGVVAGMLCVVTEDTERADQRATHRVLGAIGSDLAGTHSEPEVFAVVARHIGAGLPDLPCALGLHVRRRRRRARCVLRAGFDASRIRPRRDRRATPRRGRVDAVLDSGAERTIELDARFGDLPAGPWRDPPHTALMLPIQQQGHARPAGVFIAGLNRYRPLDDAYRRFLELLVAQIASAVANARSHAEERRRAEALAEIDRAKTAFFSNVSHEFRTPLTLMMGPLDDVLHGRRRSPATCAAHLAVAHRNSLRLLKLVNSLLDFSRIEAGRLQAHFAPTDIGALTAELAERVPLGDRARGPRAARRMRADRSRRACRSRHVGEDRLQPASNALKHTLTGEIRVAHRRRRRGVQLDGGRHRHRHPGGRVAAGVRPLLSRAQCARPHARRIGHRARAGAGIRQAARRHRGCLEHRRRRHDVHA